jgi:two-component system cell cycle response regulator
MRVLVADDDPTSRLLLKTFVTKLGHECSVAEDGDSAWSHLQETPVDVLLTDWMMPGLDGPELCRRLRANPNAAYTYIVLITSLGDREQVRAGMEAGADDYLAKPVDQFQLETRLVAAQRVTSLHSQMNAVRDQLELANIELLGQSRTDPLTGLGNRRLMERDLGVAFTLAQRNGTVFSVVLFDIDYFKAYNDRYGHPAGDAALVKTAQTIAGCGRTADTAYRYGGEEFLVLLPQQDLTSALMAAERIRRSVEGFSLSHAASAHGVITVSGGVACWSETIPSVKALLDVTDRALYRAKSAGRNVIAGPDHREPAAVGGRAASVPTLPVHPLPSHPAMERNILR